MNVPKLRFNEFSDNYSKIILKDISVITMGQSPSSENYNNDSENTVLIQGNADLQNGKVVPRIYTTQITKTCDINDIIMTVRAPVGDIAISEYNACLGRGVCAIKGNKYIYHYLEYLKQIKYWNRISKGSTIDSITSDDIKNLSINIPSEEEQIKITNILSLLDKKIELQSKKIEDLKLYKISYLKNVFSICDIRIKLKEICIIEKGKQINSDELTNDGKYYMLNGGISPSGYLNKYNTDENTITISEGGNSCGYINYNNEKFWCGGHCYKIIKPKINNKYLYQLLKYNESKIMDLRVGSGLPNIQKKDLENYSVNIHQKEKQNRISNFLDKIDQKLQLEILKLSKLQELKKGLMQSMFV